MRKHDASTGGESRTRDKPSPNTEPTRPNKLAFNNVELKVLDIALALITGTTMTAEISSRPVIVIEIETNSATQTIKQI